MPELIITEENFHEYFFDARKFKPKEGQILSTFRAVAEFVEGQHKRDVIYLLKIGKASEAVQVMQSIHGCRAPWCYSVLKEMAEDLLKIDEVEVDKKPYEMVIEFIFWTEKDVLPKDDPRWTVLDVLEIDPEGMEFKVKIS